MPPREPPPEETRSVVASARALLEELSEEGVERIDRDLAGARAASEPPPREPGPGGAGAAARAEPRAGAEPDRPPPGGGFQQLDLTGPEQTWGTAPALAEVREVLGECRRCRLHQGRTQIVFGDGDPDADLMFVGEGPGQEEDRRGLPFVGRAGELLTRMIERGLGIPRGEVYICNIVKCRPPGNRTPLADEVASCRSFLEGQIASVRPRVIVALGKPATSLLLGRDVPITKVRGTWHEYCGIPLMPTLHPAFVLRQYTPENRRLVWSDLKAAMERAREDAERGS